MLLKQHYDQQKKKEKNGNATVCNFSPKLLKVGNASSPHSFGYYQKVHRL